MAPTRVLLVDDLIMLAEALALRLTAMPDLLLLGCYRTSDQDLPEQAAKLCPDVIVVDIESSGSAAGDLVTAMSQASPAGHVVILTGSTDPNLAVAVARAGAAAWVNKASSFDHLMEVVRGVCRGCAWWPPQHLGSVLQSLREDADIRSTASSAMLDSLSPRERQVLIGIMAGNSQDVIGRELSISVNTVRTHTSSIFAKLGVHSRVAAATVAATAESRPAAPAARSRSDNVVDFIQRDDSPEGWNP